MKKYFSSYWIRSAFFASLQRFSLTFFGFINLIFLIKHLSQAQMGIWALFLTVTSIYEATKSNLLKNAHIKFASGTNDHHEKTAIASSSFLINVLVSAVFILLIIFFGHGLSRWFNAGDELSKMLYWFIPGIVFLIIFSHLEAIQQSNFDFKGGFAGYLVRQVFFFIVIFIHYIGKLPLSLSDLAMYQSISIGLGSIVLYWHSRKYVSHRYTASRAWSGKILNYGGYIFGSGIVANLFTNLDQVMTAKFLNVTTTAYYNLAARINMLVDIPSYAASEILFPKASLAHAEEGKEKIKYLFEKMVAVLIAFTIPVALVIIVFPKIFIYIVGGRLYFAAAPILQLYMITGILRPAQNQAANLLNSIGKTRLVFFLNTAFLGVLICTNYVCLSKFGFYGAAIGTLIASTLNFIAWYIVMRKEVDISLPNIGRQMLETYKLVFRKAKELLSRGKNKADNMKEEGQLPG